MRLLDKNSTPVLKFFGPRQYHSEIGVTFRIIWALAVVSIADEKVAIHVWKSSEKESFFFKNDRTIIWRFILFFINNLLYMLWKVLKLKSEHYQLIFFGTEHSQVMETIA